ncbi:hypothetical protein Lalb_Chr18g0058521 [Lupinus albus]|uniref:Uncharacterized protein n=1 Tax=Lupinus albus TaxID=3870 RepID=A0A6A4NZV2_LUPAL|nr:hypothetical protein Lalb_Chr18g0058521 [Lupinus albus]
MKPKDIFVKGPYKGFFTMHVSRSSKGSNMVNPMIIGSCDQKEAMSSGSEIGADRNSLRLMVAGSY